VQKNFTAIKRMILVKGQLQQYFTIPCDKNFKNRCKLNDEPNKLVILKLVDIVNALQAHTLLDYSPELITHIM